MKVYEGFLPKGSDVGPCLVNVTTTTVGFTAPLEHHVRHSPDGFAWGYAGSAPAELAMCILWDYLGYEPHPMLYREFKFDHVAKWGRDQPFSITGDEIDVWLDANKDIPRRVIESGVA